MQINGIDLDGLCDQVQSVSFPDTVKGRVVHIDADFLAYQVSAEKIDEEKSLDDMKHNHDVAVETLRLLAGAESVVLHLTPSGSDKGNRYDLAMLKEYQGNRKDKEKPRFLHIIRDWMAKERDAVLHMHCEADDGMAMAQYKALAEDKANLSIIASKDKDLRMIPGLHLDWDTGEIINCEDNFGYIELDKSKSTTKIIGFGWKFFWAQMLMGDTADNISGIPFVVGSVLNEFKPTKAIEKAKEVLNNPKSTDKQIQSALAKLEARKSMKCGPVLTYTLLENINNNKDAFKAMRTLYKLASEEVPFVNYRNGETISWGNALLSEAKLLWMRRQEKHSDVEEWLSEHAL